VDIGSWVLVYLLTALFWYWILSWGGARWIEGWKSWGIIGWFAGHWNVEQIRFYALIMLILETVWFGAGLYSPTVRMASLN